MTPAIATMVTGIANSSFASSQIADFFFISWNICGVKASEVELLAMVAIVAGMHTIKKI